MRTFNLVILSLGFAVVSSLGLCFIGDFFLGDSSKFIVLPLSLLLGMSSRTIVEKYLGYSLRESTKGSTNE